MQLLEWSTFTARILCTLIWNVTTFLWTWETLTDLFARYTTTCGVISVILFPLIHYCRHVARSLREISCFGTYESGVQFLILVLFNLVIIDVLDYLLFYMSSRKLKETQMWNCWYLISMCEAWVMSVGLLRMLFVFSGWWSGIVKSEASDHGFRRSSRNITMDGTRVIKWKQ